MEEYEIPRALLEAYIIGCLKRLRDELTTLPAEGIFGSKLLPAEEASHNRESGREFLTFGSKLSPAERAFHNGIREGLALKLDAGEGLSDVEIIASEGLELQDPLSEINLYPEPRNFPDKDIKQYLWVYIRGLIDSTTIISRENTTNYVIKGMVILKI